MMVHSCQVHLWVPQDLLPLEAPWHHHRSPGSALPRWPGDDQEDLDLDREVGEALISDYFSGVVQLHYLWEKNANIVQIICISFLRQKQLKGFANWHLYQLDLGKVDA